MIRWIVLALLLVAVNAEASNYWWKPGGSLNTCAASVSPPIDDTSYFGAAGGSNVQGMLNCLGAGDTAYMRAGTYTGPGVVFTPPVSGSWATAASWRSYSGEAVLFKPTGVDNAGVDILNGGAYFIISGIEFDGRSMSDSVKSGAFDVKSDYVKFEGNEIHHWDRTAIGLRFNTGGWITGNNIHHNSPTLVDCDLGTEHGCHGIYAAASNWTIENNIFDTHLSGADVQAFGYTATQFPAECPGTLCDNHGSVLRNNSFSNSYRCLFLGLDAIDIYNNLCFGAVDFAIQVLPDEANAGVPNLFNNTIYGAANTCMLFNFGGGAVAKNNICYLNGTDAIDDSNGFSTGSSNNLFGTNPLFVNAGSGDFRLSAGSPSIGAGTNLFATFQPDYTGVARPSLGAWDIGAYAYIATSRVTVIGDNFTRANESPLASPWRAVGAAGFTPLDLVSNQIQPSGTASDFVSIHTTALANDQWAQATAVNLGAGSYFGVNLRWAASGTANGYTCLITPGGTIYLSKWSAGVLSFPGGLFSYVGASGDVVRFEAVGASLSCYVNGILRASAVDSDFTSGSAGVEAYANSVAGDVVIDTFSAGNFGTAVNLVAYYDFNESSGSTVLDISGNGNHGTIGAGTTRTASGKSGGALEFAALTTGVTVPDAAILDLSSGMTLMAWVYPTASTGFHSVIVKNYTYYLYASSENYCASLVPIGGFEGGAIACNPSLLPLNTWTGLAVTYDGANLRLYMYDGVSVTLLDTEPTAALMNPTTGTLQIGASQFGESFLGRIDEARVYDGALSEALLQAAFDGPATVPRGGTQLYGAQITGKAQLQ